MSRSTLDVFATQHEPAAQPATRWRWWQGWLPLAVLPAAVVGLFPADGPGWAKMWLLAGVIFVACKWLTWRRMPNLAAPLWRQAGYLAAWPGMDAATFFDARLRPARPTLGEWLLATGNLAIGSGLLYGVARRVPALHPLLTAWIGIVGLVLVVHFGIFHLLSCGWRRVGVEARPLMNWPITATSASDFWRRRWNTAFHDLAHRFMFRPLAPYLGGAGALWAGFLASGLIHDLVISLPAAGGYGGPTLYFLVQAAAILVERSRLGRRCGLGMGLRGWLFNTAAVTAPLPLLFHEPFLTRVIVPLLRAIGDIA
jgi:Membrane bound O-acyl transferase family